LTEADGAAKVEVAIVVYPSMVLADSVFPAPVGLSRFVLAFILGWQSQDVK
jgi:hypothetical protein